MDNFYEISQQQQVAETRRFFIRVYAWMSMALVITGLTALKVASSPDIIRFIFGSKVTFYALIITELVLVVVLVGAIKKLSAVAATVIFILYSILTGVTISSIFFVFTMSSIASTFFITAGTFAGMSAFGYFTKSDLTKVGSILIMGLWGLIIASVVNLFFSNDTLYWITTYAGVLIFVGLTAYDTQKLKKLNVIGDEGSEEDKKTAIIGALTLYLDFINLFLYLLRIFGKRR